MFLRILFIILGVGIFLWGGTMVHADGLGIAQPVHLDKTVPDGSVISLTNAIYHLSSEPYDKGIAGVVSTVPAVEFQYVSDTTTTPLATTGVTNVRVNTSNGAIKKGDFVTSSSIPGVAMKAAKTGFILGVAQDTFSSQGEGMIPVALDMKLAFVSDSPVSETIGTGILGILKLSSLAVIEQPSVVLRTIVAVIVALTSLIIAFFSFARSARSGTEAIGRNPLAATHILVSQAMNTLISIAIISAGLGTAYLLLR